MSQRTIILIIGLLVAALIGVIILQWQLIQTGLAVNAEQYDKAVQAALKQAARDVEEREAAQIRVQTNGYNTPGGTLASPAGELTREIKRTTLLGGGLRLTEITTHRTSIAAQFANRSLVERIDRDKLDEKLLAEFTDNGLEEAPEYGVYDKRQQKFIVRNGRLLSEAGSDTSRHQDLLHSPFKVALFDADGDVPGYLIAYTPQRNDVIFSSLWSNLAASLFFVLIIVGCFAYTLYVIQRQKNISEMKTDFINNMTHEFKTPIATISLATDSIVSPRVSSQPDKVQRFARIIKQENKRMNDQVEKVLQMAKLDKNRLNLNLSEVDMHEVIQSAAEYISLQVEPRGGHVTTHLNADSSIVEGDMTHLSSLVNNLLDNANKYSADAPEITITTRTVAKGFQVTIADRGIGMSREARKNIFDRFYRVHTGDRHDVKGFGLGLSYVKTITEVHGGTVQVASELGKGSSFTVTLPYRQPN